MKSKKIIKIKDSIKIEVDYTIIKFGEKIALIDLEVRNIFNTILILMLMIKCMNSFNHYGKRDILINQQRVTNKYPRCNEPETWEYIV